MTMTTMGVKLDPEARKRLKQLGEANERSAHDTGFCSALMAAIPCIDQRHNR